jgi:hypothetical protein
MGKTFTSLCQFWVIISEVHAKYYDLNEQGPLADRVSLGFARSKYLQLLNWMENVPKEIVRQHDSPGDVLILQ